MSEGEQVEGTQPVSAKPSQVALCCQFIIDLTRRSVVSRNSAIPSETRRSWSLSVCDSEAWKRPTQERETTSLY